MVYKKALILMLRHKFIIIAFSFLAWTQTTAAPEEITTAPEKIPKFARDIKREIQWTNHRLIKAIEKSTDSILNVLKPSKDTLRAGEIIAQIQELKDIAYNTNEFGNYLDKLITRQEMLYILLLSVIVLILVVFLVLLIYIRVLRKKLLPSEPTFKEELIATMDKIEKNLRVIPDTLKSKSPSIEISSGFSQKSSEEDTETTYESSSKNFQIINSRVSELRKSGCTQEEIAKKLGLGKGEVEFILNLHDKGYKGKLQEENTKENTEENTEEHS